MILADTNMLSTFLKVGRLKLLSDVFNAKALNVSPNVKKELKAGIGQGIHGLEGASDCLKAGTILVLETTSREKELADGMPQSFGRGERDSLAICKERKVAFLTNERKVVNYCGKNGIECFDLYDILSSLWKLKILTKAEVRLLIGEIEAEDNLLIPSKDSILD